MNKLEIKRKLDNMKIDSNYSWELYLFNIDKRLTGSPYKITKVNFKDSNDILNYGKNLIECMEKYQLDKSLEIEEYCGENPKISCDKLYVNNELIDKQWLYFKESLMGAVVDSTEKIKVKGYIIYAKPKVPDLKDIILVKKANPIVKGEKKKSKTFKITEDETLDNFNDKIFKLYLSVDFFIFNEILYTFNLSFQEIFNIEKTLKKLKENAIKEILSKEYFDNNGNKFRNNLQSNIPLQMYMNFDIEKLIALDRLDARKDIADTLKISITNEGIFKLEDIKDIKILVRYLTGKIIKEDTTHKIYEISGNIKQRL